MSKNGEEKNRAICQRCGKRIEAESHAGSITSYMFQANSCACGRETAAVVGAAGAKGSDDFCKKCGLRKRSEGKSGSITSFMFQDLRCKCPDDPAEVQVASFPGRYVHLDKGTVVGGTYKILKKIGEGGMGEVYLAEHISLDKKCALKVIPADQVTEIGWLRFQTEAKAVAKLNHPNLVKVSDLGLHDGCLPYYAMDFVEGKSMLDLLREQGPMPLKVALNIFDQICDGLDYSHRNGIVHRDIKPANIMLTKKPDGSIGVKVLDFGLAKLTQSDRHKQSLTAVGEMLGSPFYMSPEQCEGSKIDRRSDIYSLGCALFECLVGEPPFNLELPAAIIDCHLNKPAPSLEDIVGPGVFPPALEVVLVKLLRKNPVERYQSMSELRGDLKLVADGKNVKPFYVSRGGGDNHKPENEEWRVNHLDPLQKKRIPNKSILHSTVLFCLVLVVFGFQRMSIFQKPSSVSPKGLISSDARGKNIQNLETLKTKEGSKSKSFNSGKYFCHIEPYLGQRWKNFEFPDELPIGAVCFDIAEWKWIQAKSHMGVPEYVSVSFAPSAKFVEYDCLKQFRPGEITNLYFINEEYADGLVAYCTKFRQLKTVSIIKCQLSDTEIKALDNFSTIDKLEINSDQPAIKFSKLKSLQRIRNLSLFFKDDLAPLLDQIKKSQNLRTLSCRSPKFGELDLQKIAAIKSLKSLTIIFKPSVKAEHFIHLAKSRELEILELEDWPIDANWLKTLSKIPNLRSINLPGSKLSSKEINLLQKITPNIALTNISNDYK